MTLYMVCTIRDQIKFKGKSVNINPKSIKKLLREEKHIFNLLSDCKTLSVKLIPNYVQ